MVVGRQQLRCSDLVLVTLYSVYCPSEFNLNLKAFEAVVHGLCDLDNKVFTNTDGGALDKRTFFLSMLFLFSGTDV